MYWLGHIDNRLPVGTKVRRGQRIALVSADHETPHLHFDYKL
jgi:murein DD-endopeptidase MepM/ murein hydrolase activator NlpD